MTHEEIKICLARMAGGKASDVMNFDYAGTLKYICNLEKDIKEALNLIKEGRELISANNEAIDFLESENAELRARLDKAVELPCKVGDTVYEKGMYEGDVYEHRIRKIIFDAEKFHLIARRLGTAFFLHAPKPNPVLPN